MSQTKCWVCDGCGNRWPVIEGEDLAGNECLERGPDGAPCGGMVELVDVEDVECDHPWHRNPGLITPCPECGAGSY